MDIRNDYGDCLTNLACSVRRYFGLPHRHSTLPDIDRLLDEHQPSNVVVFLFDGMGSNLIDRHLADVPNAFLTRHRLRSITSVFPATTVAATTSMLTGLNPSETGMLGWDMWYPGLGKVITTFWDSLPDDATRTPLPEATEYREWQMIRPLITDDINDAERDKAYFVSPFGDTPYETLDEMFELVSERCAEPGRKYVYAYYAEPDHTMHETGCDSDEVREIIRDIDRRVAELASGVRDALIIVTADHGHHAVENIRIDDYPDIRDCMDGDLFLEPRAAFFFVKPDRHEEFEQLFRQHLGRDFMLVNKEEIIESELFGDGEENPIFRDCLGDYLAIATGDKALLNSFNRGRKSHHAGWTDDEIYVPLIACLVDREPEPATEGTGTSFSISVVMHKDDLGRILADDGWIRPDILDAVGGDHGRERAWCVNRLAYDIDGTGWCQVGIDMHAPYDIQDVIDATPFRKALLPSRHPHLVEMCRWEDGPVTRKDASGSPVCSEDGTPIHPLDSILFRVIDECHDANGEEIEVADQDGLRRILEDGHELRIEPSDTPTRDLRAILATGWEPRA